MAKSFLKSMFIILGSMSLIAIISIWLIGLFVQEVPTSALEEFESIVDLENQLLLDKNTTYAIRYPNYIPSHFMEADYIDENSYILDYSHQKYYAMVESFSTKEKKFTHNGYIITIHSRMNSTSNPLEFVEEKLVIATTFDKKTDISLENIYFDEGGIPTVFQDTGIVDKDLETVVTIQNIEVRYFIKNIDGLLDKSQISAFFKYNGGLYKVYIETSYNLSRLNTDWCISELSNIIAGIKTT